MKLYTSPNSPFSARVRIAARLKKIELETAPLPVGGLKSEEFLGLNPVAKIPVLITDEGVSIPESEAILRYIEDRFPTPSLMPAEAAERARVNVTIRLTDLYVMDPVIRLFPHLAPTSRDQKVVDSEVARWAQGLANLDVWLAQGLPQSEAGLTLADCALAPALHLQTRIAAMLGLHEDPVAKHAGLVAYYDDMKRHPVAGPFLSDLTTAQHAYDLKAGRPSVAHWH